MAQAQPKSHFIKTKHISYQSGSKLYFFTGLNVKWYFASISNNNDKVHYLSKVTVV